MHESSVGQKFDPRRDSLRPDSTRCDLYTRILLIHVTHRNLSSPRYNPNARIRISMIIPNALLYVHTKPTPSGIYKHARSYIRLTNHNICRFILLSISKALFQIVRGSFDDKSTTGIHSINSKISILKRKKDANRNENQKIMNDQESNTPFHQ